MKLGGLEAPCDPSGGDASPTTLFLILVPVMGEVWVVLLAPNPIQQGIRRASPTPPLPRWWKICDHVLLLDLKRIHQDN